MLYPWILLFFDNQINKDFLNCCKISIDTSKGWLHELVLRRNLFRKFVKEIVAFHYNCWYVDFLLRIPYYFSVLPYYMVEPTGLMLPSLTCFVFSIQLLFMLVFIILTFHNLGICISVFLIDFLLFGQIETAEGDRTLRFPFVFWENYIIFSSSLVRSLGWIFFLISDMELTFRLA